MPQSSIEESPLANLTLFKRFKTLEALETFGEDDRTTVINVIDAIIAKRKVVSAIKPI